MFSTPPPPAQLRQLKLQAYAPMNVNPVGGGGECGQGVGIWEIVKFFDQIPQVNQKCQKSPHPRGKI